MRSVASKYLDRKCFGGRGSAADAAGELGGLVEMMGPVSEAVDI